MKMNYALILAAGLSSGLLVQPVFSDEQPAPVPPVGEVPAPAQPNKLEAPPAPLIPVAPAPSKKATTEKKTASTTAAKKADTKAKDTKAKADESLTAVPLTPGPATARQDNVNVRGQAAINSEVVTRLKKAQQVIVLEEVTKKPKPDEPSKWAKVTLPSGTMVWVHSSFIDSTTKTVKPKKLNMRSGPGENYSVVGILEKGAAITEVDKKGDWIKIEAPANSYGFVASHLLINTAPEAPVIASVEPPKPPVTTKPPEPTPVPTEVAVVTPTPEPPVATEPPTTVSPGVPPTVTAPPEVTTPAPTPVPVTPPIEVALPTPVPATPPPAIEEEEEEEPLIKRIITREGIVKRSVSIQAPSFFALESLENGKTINYLHATSTNLVLKDFWNQRVMVTGEEQLDERWPNTPVIYVESLKTVE